MNDLSDAKTKKIASWKLFLISVLFATVLLAALTNILAATLIRGIGDLVAHFSGANPSSAELAEILSSLNHAELRAHSIVPALLALLFSFCIGLLVRTNRKNRGTCFIVHLILTILLGLILFAVLLAVSVLFTDVNDIGFGKMLIFLYRNLDSLSALL